jgi:hypothetical protein
METEMHRDTDNFDDSREEIEAVEGFVLFVNGHPWIWHEASGFCRHVEDEDIE